MANNSIDLVGLDFATLKNNLKTFLKNNTQFKDINFEGSNINVLLDLLAYNTYLNGFYTNMVASEMFLDTSQLRDSIVSHAKELNYTPRSFSSSKATITINITPTTSVGAISIPKYTTFTSRVGSNTYTFSTDDSLIITNSNNGVFSTTTDVYEGLIVSETFVMNQSNTSQRFVLSNPTIDVESINVNVYEDSGQTVIPYTKSQKLIGITSTSKVFFIQAAENNQYELVFGDGVFGRRPKDGSNIVVKYRASSGELPNGASIFTADGSIDGHSNVSVVTLSSASLGSVAETVESIRFNAPRNFQVQDRAVTASDYEVLLKTRYPEIQAISVYGGEDASPPQFGKVFISVDVANATGASLSSKLAYKEYILDKTPLSVDVDFVDLDFMYVQVTSDVQYNINTTVKTSADIRTLVQGAISSYNTTNLNDFKSTLYYSNLVKQIDQCDPSVVSNDTSVTAIRRINPALNQPVNVLVDFQNPLAINTTLRTQQTDQHYGHTITSTQFLYNNVYCILVDDALGNVFVSARSGDFITVLKQVGTVNYQNGLLQLNGLNIADYTGDSLKIFARTKSKNISCFRNTILIIDNNDVSVTVTGVKI